MSPTFNKSLEIQQLGHSDAIEMRRIMFHFLPGTATCRQAQSRLTSSSNEATSYSLAVIVLQFRYEIFLCVHSPQSVVNNRLNGIGG